MVFISLIRICKNRLKYEIQIGRVSCMGTFLLDTPTFLWELLIVLWMDASRIGL